MANTTEVPRKGHGIHPVPGSSPQELCEPVPGEVDERHGVDHRAAGRADDLAPSQAAAGAVGAPLLGWLCERAGVETTLVLAGTATLLATLSAAALFGASPQRRTAFAHRVLHRRRGVAHPAGHPHQPAPVTRPRRRARVRARNRAEAHGR